MKRLQKLHHQRTNIVREIIETEVSYVSGLNLIVKHYMSSLIEHANIKNSWITINDVERIFSEVEVRKFR